MASKQLKTSPKQKWLIAVFSSSRIVAHYEKQICSRESNTSPKRTYMYNEEHHDTILQSNARNVKKKGKEIIKAKSISSRHSACATLFYTSEQMPAMI